MLGWIIGMKQLYIYKTYVKIFLLEEDVMIKKKDFKNFLMLASFEQPPEYRDNPSAENAYLPVPYFRFPKFSYCSDNKKRWLWTDNQTIAK